MRTLGLLLVVASALCACRSSIEQADLAYAREDWDAAVPLYAEGLADATTDPEIEHAKARLQEARERASESHVERMQIHVAEGDLDAAVVSGENALRVLPSEELTARVAELRVERDRVEFERRLETVEAAAVDEAAGGRPDAARALFEELRGDCADPDRVEARMRAVLPSDYQITLHGAVVLPVKPEVHWPWDGPHRTAIRDTDALLVRLGALAGIEGFITARLAGAANDFSTNAYELPDCYPVITFDGETWGGARLVRDEDLNPSWDLRILLRASGDDTRVLELVVFDKDLKDHDTVGAWQIPVGELVRQEGVREFVFVAKDGRLGAGGIVALTFSVERFGP